MILYLRACLTVVTVWKKLIAGVALMPLLVLYGEDLEVFMLRAKLIFLPK